MTKMLKRLLKPQLALLLVLSIYLCITLSALFDTDHILYNLEPYPDGILYTIAAKNFIAGDGLQLNHNGYSIPIWVPPLYPLFLSLFYLVHGSPIMFYLANITLGLTSLYLVYWTTGRISQNNWAGVGATVLYLLHAYISWLPTVPMTENIALVFLLVGLAALLQEQKSKKLLLGLVGIVGLIYTRYALTPVALTLFILVMLEYFTLHLNKKNIFKIIGLFCGIILVFVLLRFSQFTTLLNNLNHSNQFYSLQLVMPNTVEYSRGLLGFPIQFLWLKLPFTTGLLFLSLCGTVLYLWKHKHVSVEDKKHSWQLLLIFLSQFPLLLIFYTVDARYYIYSLPILCILSAFYLCKLFQIHRKITVIVTAVTIISLLFSQKDLYKQLVANNILSRSSAVQYQAVQHFDQYFKNTDTKNSYLVTALPPFFITTYTTNTPRLLPLSLVQEFLQKGEYAWGDDVNYSDLKQDYTDRLLRGERVYISNAYVTHQQRVIQDFEILKEEFTLTLVSSGCLDACNIYTLGLKE